MHIPTKNDLISPETKMLARGQLVEYLDSVFVSSCFQNQDQEDIYRNFILDLYEGKIDLVPFFDEYDEIVGHEKEFKHFCEAHFKSLKHIPLVPWDHEDLDAMELISDRAQFKEYRSLIEDEIYLSGDQEVFHLSLLMKKIQELPEKEECRFKAAYLSIQNTLAIDAKKAPSDMPMEARGPMQKRARGGKMSYTAKKQALEDILYPSGFWQKFGEFFVSELVCKEHRKQHSFYKSLLKKAKFSNTKRDKEKMACIIDQVFPNEKTEIKEELKKDIKNFMLRKELSPLPLEAQSDRDKILSGFRSNACKEFLEVISLLVQEKLLKRQQKDSARVEGYLVHRTTCPRCRKYQEALEERMLYRIERMKRAEKAPLYPFHSYKAENVQKTQSRDLVQYYQREFEHNPCDMYLYYLLLAYKKAGHIEKAIALYNHVKELPEYRRLQQTQLATELQGA